MMKNHLAAVLESSTSPKDYPEDFKSENGNYFCTCVGCDHVFKGHKRRVLCKECTPDTTPKGSQQEGK